MGYKRSPPYVQRMINSILRLYKTYTRCYVNDIIIFFKIFKDHIEYLDKIFNLFDILNVILKEPKAYLGYPLIILLDQRVDGLDILYSKNRITAILNLEFPITLKDLKKYRNLIS
jgi:hypothetical protein